MLHRLVVGNWFFFVFPVLSLRSNRTNLRMWTLLGETNGWVSFINLQSSFLASYTFVWSHEMHPSLTPSRAPASQRENTALVFIVLCIASNWRCELFLILIFCIVSCFFFSLFFSFFKCTVLLSLVPAVPSIL